MTLFSKRQAQDRPPHLWREFYTCLVTMLFFASGGGGFLLLIVGYLEKRSVPVTEIGSVMSLLSIVEGGMCLLIGHFYRGKYTRDLLLAGLTLNGSAALILAFTPGGWLIWLAAALNGAGFGVFTVIMYVAALERRPTAIKLGLAVGLYTATIAGGNGLGALFVGWMTDQYGFSVSFSFCVGCYLVASLGLLTLTGKIISKDVHAPAEKQTQSGIAYSATPAWMLAMLTAVMLSSINMVFDILFPVYTLRAGMSFTLVGTLSGIKMVFAAVVRPLTGLLMTRWNAIRLNNGSLTGLALGTVLIPISGLGFGLAAVVVLMGVAFGSVRTTSATLAVIDESNPQVISRRISYYNTCLTVGQTISPLAIGLIADRMQVTNALVVVPLCFLGLFGIGSLFLPRLVSNWDAANTRTVA